VRGQFVVSILLLNAIGRPALGFVTLQDELIPRARFSERVLSNGVSTLQTQLLTVVGQDTVETLINSQTEKRIFAALGMTASAAINASDKVRFDLQTSALRSTANTEVTENSGWSKSTAASEVLATGLARFQWNDGLRLGGGATWILRPAAIEKFAFAGQSGQTNFHSFTVLVPELVMSKSAGSGWSAGIGYRPKAVVTRTFVREAASETTELSEEAVLDECWSAGVVANLPSSRTLSLDVNLHGSTGAQKRDTSSGVVADEDNNRRYEVSSMWGLGDISAHRLSLGLGYQSLAYADQGSVSPQTIPMWSVLVQDDWKQGELTTRWNALLGYGSDLQSLPDLNAKYRRLIFSLQVGMVF